MWGIFCTISFPCWNRFFTGNKKVILYNSKDIRHRLSALGLRFNAPFEDVSLIKYLAEGTGKFRQSRLLPGLLRIAGAE